MPPAPGATRSAAIAGVAPLGLTPCRRTAAIIDPAPLTMSSDWPMLNDCRRDLVRAAGSAHPADGVAGRRDADARRTTCSPTNWTSPSPSTACSRRWTSRCRASSEAGPACAPSPRTAAWPSAGTRDAEGFFWCVGQGGYGIQTSPAAGQLVADLVAGRDPGPAAEIVPAVDPRRFTAVRQRRDCTRPLRNAAAECVSRGVCVPPRCSRPTPRIDA